MEAFTNSLPFYISLLLFILTLFYYIWKTKLQTKPKTPPSPPGRWPIIGHLHMLDEMPHITFSDISKRLDSPIIYVDLGQIPTVVISSSQLARQVLKTYDHIFANRPHMISGQYLSFGCCDVSFSPYGAYWRQVRKICVTELLSAKRVHSFELIRGEEIDRLLAAIKAQSGTEVDISKLFFTLSNDILCRVAFGKRFMENVKEGQNRNLVSVLTESQALFAGFCVADFFPGWGWLRTLNGYTRRCSKIFEDLKFVCDEIVQEHLQRKNDEDKEDFVDVLLRVQKRHDLEVPITDDNIKALVLDMFIAGTDTSAATLEWALTELARHPRILRKAQEEVRSIAGSKGRVEENDLQHFHYMGAVIKETMRLHPVVPLLVPRESMEKCVIDGYEIPAKTRVMVNSYAIGRDPNSWENPLEYKPERFVEDEIDFKDQDFRFIPFGGGRRGCPGYNFGLATIEMTLARLLFHFDWELPSGVKAEDVDLSEIFGLASRKKTALHLVPTINKDYEYKGAAI